MKRQQYQVNLLVILWTLSTVAVIGCSDDGGNGVDVDCNDLGAMLTDSTTMAGFFDFGDGRHYPLSVDLDVSSQSFVGQTEFDDASQHFEGTCSGILSSNGTLTGDCIFIGDFELEVDFTGNVGQNGGCGRWVNEADQSGQWKVAP